MGLSITLFIMGILIWIGVFKMAQILKEEQAARKERESLRKTNS